MLICVHDGFDFFGNGGDGCLVGDEDEEVLIWEGISGGVDMFTFGGDTLDGPTWHGVELCVDEFVNFRAWDIGFKSATHR